MSAPDPPEYYISCGAADLARIRGWNERAIALGVQDEFQAAFNAMCRQLATDPTRFGDPLFPYRYANLIMYHAMRRMLRVYYAVDEARRIVYIKRFHIVSGHPLAEG